MGRLRTANQTIPAMRRAPRALPMATPAMAPGDRLGGLEEPEGPLLTGLLFPLLLLPLPLPPLPVFDDPVWPGNCRDGVAEGGVRLG